MQSRRHPTNYVICHPAYYLAGERIARPTSRAAGLRPPWITIWAAYASLARKAVTNVTVARRRQIRRLRLDAAVGALRNTGLFVRPHPLRWCDDAADGGESQLVPTSVVAAPSR
jgi:hypothetical protein